MSAGRIIGHIGAARTMLTDGKAPTLEELAAIREAGDELVADVMRDLLDAVLAEADRDDANVAELARRAGIARGTVYNELGRRQERRDELSANGQPPAPAPADLDFPDTTRDRQS